EPPPEPEPLDNLLRIDGEFCTEPSADLVFPVKVIYVIDQSTSLQCTDSQNIRFEALNSSIDQLRRQPNTSFGFIGFSSWSRLQNFTRNRDDIARFTDPAGGLGPATDYQGALATAIGMIERDMVEIGPALRARTRYQVNFVSDGVPTPRCNPGCEDTISACADGNDNDGDGQVDGADEDCTDITNNALHPDNTFPVCNTDREIPEGEYVDMDGICPEYNQPTQILQRVQELMSLAEIYSAGGVTLNTVLLFSPQDVVEGVCPGALQDFGFDRTQARSLLQAMSDEGNGTYRDVNLASGDGQFLSFDITTIKAEQTLYSLAAFNRHAASTPEGLLPDSDRDGIADEVEAAELTDRDLSDSDDDRYSDLFELRNRNQGFEPADGRIPAISCSDERDGDGDGLRDCEEQFLGTSLLQPDTDGDTIDDRTELIQGTDPLVADGLADLDFDGVLNLDEIKGGTNPVEPDEDRYRVSRILYDVVDRGLISFNESDDEEDAEERHCYDFNVSRIPLVITPLNRERGLNRVVLQVFEGPAQVSGVPGEVKLACFEAFYQGGTVKNPESGVIDVTQNALDTTRDTVQRELDQVVACPWFGDGDDSEGSPQEVDRTRGDLEEMVDACMPIKIQLGNRLFRRDELLALTQRLVRGDLTPRIPDQAWELFTPIQEFDPEVDCFRPWEFDRLSQFLVEAEAACAACAATDDVMTDTAQEGDNNGNGG
ncbi:MAG: hypothetical protein AAFS10_15720, partial [Myxococcota bacterium]